VTQLSCVCAGNIECKSSRIVREVAAENLYLTHKWRNKIVILRLKKMKRKHKEETKYRDTKELAVHVFFSACIVCAINAIFIIGNV
jgi:hypothetical protein